MRLEVRIQQPSILGYDLAHTYWMTVCSTVTSSSDSSIPSPCYIDAVGGVHPVTHGVVSGHYTLQLMNARYREVRTSSRTSWMGAKQTMTGHGSCRFWVTSVV